ncbi:MAG: gephyrin-like molybdotransferase Glp [Pseudomonadota bacterium]|nr:gephyrin-like molybdotransferase Glp [Pseudomonadota bacterium]
MSEGKLLPVAEAQNRIIDAMPTLPIEQISVANAFGRTLAAPILSRRDQPPTDVSAMDGYAVRAEDVATVPVELSIVGYAPAGHSYRKEIGPYEAVRIFTGAPIPAGANTIVLQENTEKFDEKVRVTSGEAPPGKYVRSAGLDFSQGEALLPAGRTLTARDVGLAAAMNVPWLQVRRKPRISILSTGDEIVMPGDPVGEDQIVSSNALSLAAIIKAIGGDPIDLGIAPDRKNELATLASAAIGSDILLTTGGASVGDHDLVQDALGDIGLKTTFWKIAMRPGKPLIFGNIADTFLIGLPGNPVSSTVCAIMFLGPAIRKMLGIEPVLPERLQAKVTHGLPENDEREDYMRGTLLRDEIGNIEVSAHQIQDSSMYATMARSDVLIVRPPYARRCTKGEVVDIIPLKGSHFNI